MYKLIEIIEDDATRFVKLKNMSTNAIEECFDDSALVSETNFSFMQVGQQYDCKIKLFGKTVTEQNSNGVLCNFLNKEIMIGQKPMVEVQVDKNKYYIAKQTVKEYLEKDSFILCFTRKDLIQVNDVVHADLL